ncbi:MAG TPA: response regulator [Candidatus Eisenbacteria bacterium]
MSEPVRIIHLEDRPKDAELVRAALDDSGLEYEVITVSTREAFVAALERESVDLILSDYALPGFDGLAALSIALRQSPDVPFILVSGTMGEEAAIDSLRSGATDYVLKHRLSRLGPAVRRALEEAAERRTRRAAEEMLERERNFLRALLDSLEAGVVACDQEGTLTLFNRATRELHGLPERPLPPSEWASHYHLFAADGVRPLRTEEIPLARVLRGERLKNVEISIRHTSGAVRTVLASGQPITDDRGRHLGGVVALHDITGRKQLEAEFRQAQKMEAMGRLAAGVAHDFNNLLTVISGYCELLHGRLTPEHPGRAEVDVIAHAGRRASDLTRQLLAFSRRQVLETRILDLNDVVTGVRSMLRHLLGPNVELGFSPTTNLGHVRADAGQIEQVLLNLVINARDAMPQGGRIVVATENRIVPDESPVASSGPSHRGAAGDAPAGAAPLPFEIPPGSYATLSVTDTGTGMDAETAAQVFVPFFTTKEVGHGTGLGLSTVHGIVSQSGGYIGLETAPGAGTTFTVYLPLAAAEKDGREPEAAETIASRTSGTILVVDDEPAIRGLVHEILRVEGYTVIEAEDGRTALRLIDRGTPPIDLALVDLALPGLSGRELGARLEKSRPELPVLYMSGHGGNDADGARSSPGRDSGFIQKPFSPAELRRRVRDALEGPTARAA